MTQTHHTTWQRGAGVDREGSPSRTQLEEAGKIEGKECSLALCVVFDTSKQTWRCNLWQLFEGPSQSEEPSNVGALRVIHTRAPCPCTRRQQGAWLVASNKGSRLDKGAASHLQGTRSGARWRTWPCWTSSEWPRFLPARSRLSRCPPLDLCHRAKGMTTLFSQHRGIKHSSSAVCATMTAPVLEPSCDVTPTSKVAKTGEWSLEKMSSVQPGAKINPWDATKEKIYCCFSLVMRSISQEGKKAMKFDSDCEGVRLRGEWNYRKLMLLDGREWALTTSCCFIVVVFLFHCENEKKNTSHVVWCGIVGDSYRMQCR